jgi:protein TonB|nr:MAG: hypothetical protein KatS3mg041_1388 [Bacteroidota bacterium]
MRNREERIALAGSLLLHAVLALLFWVVVVRSEPVPMGLLEVDFGPLREGRPVRAALRPESGPEIPQEVNPELRHSPHVEPEARVPAPEPPARPVEAPQRVPAETPERIRTPRASEVRPERPSPEPARTPAPSAAPSGQSPEQRPAGGSPEGTGRAEEGTPGTGFDRDRSAPFALSWEGNLTRSILRQRLPAYPIQIEAEIRIRFTVDPQGRVISMIPLQKGPPELERAAMEALREWRFNPLPPHVPQLPQTGVITFRFRLQ